MIGFRIKGLTAALAFSIPAFAMAFFVCRGQANSAGRIEHGKDAPPIVKITAPANNSTENWNALVNYSVVVSWQGKSTEYQEIPSNQVLISATYVPDLSKRAGEPAQAAVPGLLDIISSGCVGCHEFRARAMGPSFAAIAQRYQDNQATSDTLARYIREGSTGVWGRASMPPHPELTEEQSHAIVRWIVKDAANPNVNYYVGTEGAFRMEAPATPGSGAGMILTASYTAPVSPSPEEQAPHGEVIVVVRGK
jgi:cytochrome c551/c552